MLRWSRRLKEAKANPIQLHQGSHPLLQLLPNRRGPLAPPAHTDHFCTSSEMSWNLFLSRETHEELQGLGSLSGIKGPALGMRHEAGLRKLHAFNDCRMDAKCGTEAKAVVRPGKGKALVLQNWDRGVADNLRQPAGIRVGIWLGKLMPSLSKENLRGKKEKAKEIKTSPHLLKVKEGGSSVGVKASFQNQWIIQPCTSLRDKGLPTRI